MSDTTTPPAAPATPKRKYTRTPKPVKVRTLDPDIKRLQQEHSQKVANLRASKASARMLVVIIEKRLPKLTAEDRNKLADLLAKTTTPPLPAM